MIHYEAFKALPVAERDEICAEKMGWRPIGCGPGRSGWKTGAGLFVVIDENDSEAWSPTTDRNDAVMMVEKVWAEWPLDGSEPFTRALKENGPRPLSPHIVLCLPPCLIAYCSCVALEEA